MSCQFEASLTNLLNKLLDAVQETTRTNHAPTPFPNKAIKRFLLLHSGLRGITVGVHNKTKVCLYEKNFLSASSKRGSFIVSMFNAYLFHQDSIFAQGSAAVDVFIFSYTAKPVWTLIIRMIHRVIKQLSASWYHLQIRTLIFNIFN